MNHSEKFYFYNDFYFYGYVTKYDVWKAAKNGFITKDEYEEITGEKWTPVYQ